MRKSNVSTYSSNFIGAYCEKGDCGKCGNTSCNHSCHTELDEYKKAKSQRNNIVIDIPEIEFIDSPKKGFIITVDTKTYPKVIPPKPDPVPRGLGEYAPLSERGSNAHR